MKSHDREFQGLIRQLVDTLLEELRQNQRLLRLVRRKKVALAGEFYEEHESTLRVERELLTNAVTLERDRISLITELGQLLGHPSPARLRLAEIMLYAGAECRDELLEIRDDFRDVADELEDLTAVEPIFSRHRKDQVRLYVTPSRSKLLLEDAVAVESRPARGAATIPSREGN